MRAAIYARYSSELQSATSIEDQESVCRQHADRAGWTVVAFYSDPAISGAHIQNRPGIISLMEDANAGRFDIVLTESLDRLSRDQEHTAWLYKRLNFRDIAIHTLAEGRVDPIQIGFKGTMGAVFLKDLGDKVRRGQRGQVERGRAAGGIPYGYRLLRAFGPDGQPERGLLEIDEAQASIVRRIFGEYVSGMSPRMIATRLNADEVPSPRGGKWNQSTINGAKSRGRGILHNPLYIGIRTWGRASFRKDPDSGRRREVKTSKTDWLTKEAPELRIIDDDTWQRVQEAKAIHSAKSAAKAKRPKRLLSGLVFCGCCASPYIVVDKARMGCASNKEARGCTNGKRVNIGVLERHALEGLREQLLTPAALSTFVDEYHRQMRAERTAEQSGRRALERKVADCKSQISRVVDAIAGVGSSPALEAKLVKLEGELAQLSITLAEEPQVIDLTPDLPAFYRKQVETLTDLVQEPDLLPRATAILRDLVERLVLRPGEGRGEFELEIHGLLAGLIRFATGKPAARSSVVLERGLSLAERGGFEPPIGI